METCRSTKALHWLWFGAGLAAAAYGTYVGAAWARYGHPRCPRKNEESDALLDRFMPVYEVSLQHQVRVAAPADVTLAAAYDVNLLESKAVRAIFKTREVILGGKNEDSEIPASLRAQTEALGWRVLAEVPHRELVLGAVTQPWAANSRFLPVPVWEFEGFQKRGYVKIAWTMRADALGPAESILRTETRVATTDESARAKFRVYWAFFSPGMNLIRRILLRMVKREAERRGRSAEATKFMAVAP